MHRQFRPQPNGGRIAKARRRAKITKSKAQALKRHFVRPQAIEAMQEIGIDISGHRSKSLNEFLGQQFDYVITVCDNAKERCPIFPGNAIRIHWSFDDPAAATGNDAAQLAVFRRVRDEIRVKLSDLSQR